MWRNGVVEWHGDKLHWEAKVFDRGSIWGIDGGRVSKLLIYDEKDGAVLWNYDRGWMSAAAPQDLVLKILENFPDQERINK